MSSSTLRYIPALDGLRAVAVIGVILFHSGFSWAKGGFLGVDAFFVLSGFLISALLLGEWRQKGTIRFAGFWGRRARRLLPAVVLMLVAVAAYASLLADPDELVRIRDDAVATVLYLANWHFVFSGQGYFEALSTPSPFRHCWSLSIEEQFYFLWPVLVFFGLRLSSKRPATSHAPRLLIALTFTALLASVTATALLFDSADVSRAYYGTDTRAQALLVGAVLAMLWSDRAVATRTLDYAALLSGAALIALWIGTSGNAPWLYRGGFLVHALLVAIVIARVAQPDPGWLGRALSWSPLRWLGKISYGVYLWHWPVFVALSPTRLELPSSALFALRMAVTLAFAVASYALVERPMRERARTGWRSALALAAAAAASLEMIVVAALSAPAHDDLAALEAVAEGPPEPPWDVDAAAGPIRVLLVGDSVASSLAGGFERASVEHGFVFWNAARPGCGLASDYGERWMEAWVESDGRCVPGWREYWRDLIDAGDPDVVLLLAGAQDTYDRRVNGATVRFDGEAGARLAKSDLEDAIDVLSAKGAAVVLLTAPHYRLGWPQTLDVDRSYLNPVWIDRYNELVKDVGKQKRVSVLDFARIVQPNGEWVENIDDVRVRQKDMVHLTPAGADLAAQAMVNDVVKLGKNARNEGE